MARAREGDHHALDVVAAQDVAQVVEAAEDGDVEAEVVVDLVVDDADRVEAVLAVAAQAVEQLGGDEARADDERPLAQRARAVQRGAQRRAAGERDERAASGAATSAAAIGAPAPSASAAKTSGQLAKTASAGEAADLRDAAGPRAERVDGVEAAHEGEDGPGDGDDRREDQRPAGTLRPPATAPASPATTAATMSDISSRRRSRLARSAPRRGLDGELLLEQRRGQRSCVRRRLRDVSALHHLQSSFASCGGSS